MGAIKFKIIKFYIEANDLVIYCVLGSFFFVFGS